MVVPTVGGLNQVVRATPADPGIGTSLVVIAMDPRCPMNIAGLMSGAEFSITASSVSSRASALEPGEHWLYPNFP